MTRPEIVAVLARNGLPAFKVGAAETAARLVELEEREKWTQAAERRPKNGVPVLVWTVTSGVYPELAYWDDPGGLSSQNWHIPGRGCFSDTYVTHRRPLPEGPKLEERAAEQAARERGQ